MIDLDQEEHEILQAFEAGEMETVADRESELKKHREYAAATFKKDKRITIRISSRDLNALRKRALVEGIPYQTLVTSVLHKYVNRQLVEKQPVD
ncbi:MAG TPA: antitoxin [Anaerolineae bacterium]|nr:antitoxin [Anaerolineae bacterium]